MTSKGRRAVLTSTQRGTAVWTVLLGYLILAGGTPSGELNGWIRALNGLIAALVIFLWVRALPRENDSTDRGMVWALLAFLVACAVSTFPRQSFDAAIQATALVALFYLARRKLATDGRAGIESAAAWLCLGLSAVVALAWALGWVDWLIASGGSAPPLNLPLATGPFGHRHDVALIAVLLAPALWSRSFQGRRWVSIAGSLLVGAIVLVDSSRNVELAVIAAFLAVAVGYRLRVSARGLRIGVAAAAGLVIAVTAVALASPVLLSRIANVGTLLGRVTLWTEAVGVWLQNPLAGIGPGGFPFGYMLSDHFRVSPFDPRHPDNAAVQLLVEAGVVGLVAAVLCTVTLVRGARRRFRREPQAVWALLVFAFATLGANPTDFLFLVVPALVWAAIVVPPSGDAHRVETTGGADAPGARMRVGLTFASAVVMVAVSSVGVASISYEVGRDAYSRGDAATAESALTLSIRLDPSLAIYHRERASLVFARGDLAGAEAGYREALAITQYDPVAWRGLALVLLAASENRSASIAADRAVDLMFLAPENQLVRAAIARAGADEAGFGIAMRTALQRAPQLASITWADTILGSADRVATARQAANPGLSPDGGEMAFGRVLLALFVSRADVAAAAAAEVDPAVRLSAASLAAAAACDIKEADRLKVHAARTEGEQAGFWIANAIVSAASGRDHDRTVVLALRFLRQTGGRDPEVASALAGSLADGWRFRRTALGIRASGAGLPSSRAAQWDLLTHPADAFGRVDSGWPPICAGSTERN